LKWHKKIYKMYYLAELVVKSYMPDTLKKGMLFVNHNLLDLDDDNSPTLFKLSKDVPDDEKERFSVINGAPVELFIVDEKGTTIAGPDKIGIWEDVHGNKTPLSIKHINYIFQNFDGLIEIDDASNLYDGKVVMRAPEEEDEEEEEFDGDYMDPDDEIVNGFNHEDM
jgi:hypothetical protein